MLYVDYAYDDDAVDKHHDLDDDAWRSCSSDPSGDLVRQSDAL